jgi:nucleotide-binding universal stress UspA family protein
MTVHKTVLVPLDGSVHATTAIPVARGLAKLLHATVAALHVSDDALAPTERMKLSYEDVRGLVVERRSGSAATVLVQEATERHAAMIVMCPQIRTGLRSRALGSVAEAVPRTARCPIVLVPSVRGRKEWALHQLLVPHDGTPTSAAAMRPATDLSSLAAAELVVLHVATRGAQRPTEPGTLGFPRYVDHAHNEWPARGREFIDRPRAVGGARDGTDRFELFYWSNTKGRWTTFGNMGRMKLTLKSAHEIVENDPIFRVPRSW